VVKVVPDAASGKVAATGTVAAGRRAGVGSTAGGADSCRSGWCAAVARAVRAASSDVPPYSRRTRCMSSSGRSSPPAPAAAAPLAAAAAVRLCASRNEATDIGRSAGRVPAAAGAAPTPLLPTPTPAPMLGVCMCTAGREVPGDAVADGGGVSTSVPRGGECRHGKLPPLGVSATPTPPPPTPPGVRNTRPRTNAATTSSSACATPPAPPPAPAAPS